MREQTQQLMQECLSQFERYENARDEWESLKEQLKDAKKRMDQCHSELTGRLESAVRADRGEQVLPFPDPEEEPQAPPVLEAAAQMFKNAAESDNQAEPSIDSDLTVLVGQGVPLATVELISDALSISTLRELCAVMQEEPKWETRVKGLGQKKRQKIDEAVQRILDQGASAHPVDEFDNRQKKCVECGDFRDPSVENCPGCNSPTFELQNPSTEDLQGESTFNPELVEDVPVPCVDESVQMQIYLFQHESGMWFRSASVAAEDVAAGRTVPHHDSEPYGTRDEAIISGCAELSSLLIDLELDGLVADAQQFAARYSIPEEAAVAS